MAVSTVSFTFGDISFAGEAEDKEWLTKQLDKFLDIAKSLPQSANSLSKKMSSAAGGGEKFTATLAGHLKAKGGETNQTKRFLAAADWLRLRGNEKLNTAVVTKALSDNHQKRLGNPSECLNQNVGKGFCEKTADGFFITPDGLKDLGYE